MNILHKLDPRPVEVEFSLILTTAQLNTVVLALNYTKGKAIGSSEYLGNSANLLILLKDEIANIEED